MNMLRNATAGLSRSASGWVATTIQSSAPNSARRNCAHIAERMRVPESSQAIDCVADRFGSPAARLTSSRGQGPGQWAGSCDLRSMTQNSTAAGHQSRSPHR